jgi:hypothetical protein
MHDLDNRKPEKPGKITDDQRTNVFATESPAEYKRRYSAGAGVGALRIEHHTKSDMAS